MGIRITENDVLLFKYIFEHNFLTRHHIKKYIWSDYHTISVERRLAKLTKHGYLKKRPYPRREHNRHTILMGTKRALFESKDEKKFKRLNRSNTLYPTLDLIDPKIHYKVNKDIKEFLFFHDSKLLTIRLLFEDLGADYWFSHVILFRRKSFKTTPDGTFFNQYKDKKCVFAVELENTLKHSSRYETIFEKYLDTNIDYVIYITTDDVIYKSLAKKKFTPKFFRKVNVGSDYRRFYLARFEDIMNGNYVVKNPEAKTAIDLKKEVFSK